MIDGTLSYIVLGLMMCGLAVSGLSAMCIIYQLIAYIYIGYGGRKVLLYLLFWPSLLFFAFKNRHNEVLMDICRRALFFFLLGAIMIGAGYLTVLVVVIASIYRS